MTPNEQREIELKIQIEKDLASPSGVYYIVNKANSKVYIGSSVKSVVKRLENHRTNLIRGKHKNGRLQREWDRFGEEMFVMGIYKTCEFDRCLEIEQTLIDTAESYLPHRGYNICPVAGNTQGYKFSEESKAKISKSNTGKKASDETKRKMSEKRKGVKHSMAHQAAVNAALNRPDVRAKISAGISAVRKRKGNRWYNEETL